MVENRPVLTLVSHLILLLGLATVALPLWVAFVASTLPQDALVAGVIPLLPGDAFLANWGEAVARGLAKAGSVPVGMMLVNSLVMALGIALGKIVISILSAYAVVYFRFPFRMPIFWLIFVTLMLPVEVRLRRPPRRSEPAVPDRRMRHADEQLRLLRCGEGRRQVRLGHRAPAL